MSEAVDRGDAGAGDEAGFRGCEMEGTTCANGFGVIVVGEALAGPGFGAVVVEDVVRSTAEVVDEEETAPPPFPPSGFLLDPREKRPLSVEWNGMLFRGRTVGG